MDTFFVFIVLVLAATLGIVVARHEFPPRLDWVEDNGVKRKPTPKEIEEWNNRYYQEKQRAKEAYKAALRREKGIYTPSSYSKEHPANHDAIGSVTRDPHRKDYSK